MSKLCLGTLLTAIRKCAIKKGFVQSRDFSDMLYCLGCMRDIDPSLIGHIVRGAKNPPIELLDSINNMDPDDYSKITTCFDGISSRIDINKIELFGKIIKKIADGDSDIKDESVVDLVNGTKKRDLPGNLDNLSSFIAGIYIYVIKYTDNKGKTEFVKEIDDRFIAEILSESADKITLKTETPAESRDERIMIAAKAFLIKHEKEKELIPLCQIAFEYKPHHQHVRSMYTEYNILPYSVRKYILEQCESDHLIDGELHYTDGLRYFLEDLRTYELSAERYMYMFGQYLFRAFEYYSDCKINMYDTYSFIRLYTPPNTPWATETCSNLNQYIDDYLWMKDKKIDSDAMMPMDYLWYEKSFESCDEEALTFWLCRFIIDVCNNLINRIKNSEFPYSFPEDRYAETQEDLFYCALLSLHNHYLCHQDTQAINQHTDSSADEK